LGNLSTPNSVQKLQTALHAKAKAEAGYRFYALYDKIYREDILAFAYAQCRSNKGAPGVDGQDFADIEAYGVERWLGELALALRQESYKPDAIRRVNIPKPNGKLRPLGISTVRDRVAMTAATLVLDPIFEADLPAELYAYRAGRNAQQAVTEVEEQLFRGHSDVVDADLADYFGSIPHADLMKSVARRVVDRRVLHLIKMWLECAVEETDDRGGKRRTTEARDSGRGIPQGSPLSPLLANLYMRRFVLGWRQLGLEQRLGARLVTYADDLVIRRLAPGTQAFYVSAVAKFARHFGCSPDQLGYEEVRAYQLHLVQSGLAVGAVNRAVTALRFFYKVTMGRRDAPDMIPLARRPDWSLSTAPAHPTLWLPGQWRARGRHRQGARAASRAR
jgi:group II intron reverse transcriptase/maturase